MKKTMLSKAKIKLIHALQQKKQRQQEGRFVAEGPKVVGDLMAVMPASILVATDSWLQDHEGQIQAEEIISVTSDELRKVSFLQHPQEVLALFPLAHKDIPLPDPTTDLVLALDGVQDPGNLGTIIRIADWFGITDIICSEETADVYNPKVVQATMGSIARVRLHYMSLDKFLDNIPKETPIYGTLLDGQDIYSQPLSPYGVIIMGNEGKGISPAIARRVTHRLLIPNFPAGRPTADSLNVAIATAITCAEFRRRMEG
ncbi:MAG: RNA methyltransferase [Prevotella sp.]|nr:RNA methyltransferase [Prevotella sp.]